MKTIICIFMKFNEIFCNERKIRRKIKGCTYKMTNISPTICTSVSNLVPIQCLDIVFTIRYNKKNIYYEYL